MLKKMISHAKRIFLCSVLLVWSTVTFAQELKVVSFEQTMEAYASVNKRLDNNDVPCAVLKISIPDVNDFSFEAGFRVGDVIYNPGEAIVYLGEGARNITIKSNKYGTLKYEFPNRMKLKKLITYRMSVKIPSLGIGGRKIAFGVSGGYLLPMISASSDGGFTGSAVNYTLGNGAEKASYSASGGFSVGAHVDFRIYRSWHLITGVNFLHYKYSNEFDADVELKIKDEGVRYGWKGTSQNRYKEEYTMSVLEIPVLASYRLPLTNDSHVQFNAGPVISYGLSAKLNLSGNTDSETMRAYKVVNGQLSDKLYDDKYHSLHYSQEGEFDMYSKEIFYSSNNGGMDVSRRASFEEAPLKRLNFGARLGVAYEYKGIFASLEYNLLLSNMANEKYWEGNRWMILDQPASDVMKGYKQRNSYLKISLGYTFRY